MRFGACYAHGMELRQWIGLAFLVPGIVLQPIGWMFLPWMGIVSVVLIVIGIGFILTDRYLAATEGDGTWPGPNRAVPGDLDGHSGWDAGGRSDAHSDVGGAGDAGH